MEDKVTRLAYEEKVTIKNVCEDLQRIKRLAVEGQNVSDRVENVKFQDMEVRQTA